MYKKEPLILVESYAFWKSVKHTYTCWHRNFKLDFSRKFFYLKAVLSVTGCIWCIVFKRVENNNSNGPWGGCFTVAMTSEQILMTDNSSASPSLLFGMIFVNWFLFGSSWQCWVSQDASDVSYSNGLKIPTQMVHEVDALPWQWRVNKFWWQIIVLPPRHCYLVWYLSIDFCSEVPGSVECHRMHRMYRIQMGWKYQLKWSTRWMLYRGNDEWTNSDDR